MRRALSGPETVCQPLPTLANSANCFSHRTEKPQMLRALEELNRNKFNWATLKLCTKSLGVPITSNAATMQTWHDKHDIHTHFMHFHPSVYWKWAAGIPIRATHCQKSECHKSSYKRQCQSLHFNLIIVLQDSAAHIACKTLFWEVVFELFDSSFSFFCSTLLHIHLCHLNFWLCCWKLETHNTIHTSFVHADQSTQWHYSQLNRQTHKKYQEISNSEAHHLLHLSS